MNKIKKYLYIFLLLEIILAYAPAYAADVYDYTQNNTNPVSSQIEKYLCAPSPVPASQTSVTNGVGTGLTQYSQNAAANNANANDLYKCINQIYKFAIILGSVIAVFFIVIAGWIYMSASGAQESVDKAKNILETSITALVILLSGFLLLKAINPDLIQFKSIQPPSVVLDTTKWNSYQALSQSFSSSELGSNKSFSGTLEGNYYRFSQCDGNWKNTPYTSATTVCKESNGTTSTICSSGCGPTSLATVLKNMGKNVDPGVIADQVVKNNGRICGVGTSGQVLESVAQSYGVKTLDLGAADALSAVKSGGVVIAAMGPGKFTTGGHFITIYGYASDGNYLIADSGPYGITKATAEEITASYKTGFQVKQ